MLIMQWMFTHNQAKSSFLCLVLNLSTTAFNVSWMSLWIFSNAKDDSLSCPIVAGKYVFTRFKTLKDISVVAVEGGIVI
jgi:hypothetical protein